MIPSLAPAVEILAAVVALPFLHDFHTSSKAGGSLDAPTCHATIALPARPAGFASHDNNRPLLSVSRSRVGSAVGIFDLLGNPSAVLQLGPAMRPGPRTDLVQVFFAALGAG